MDYVSKTEFNFGTFQIIDPELLIENEEILVWQSNKMENGIKMLYTTLSLIRKNMAYYER